MEDRCIQGITQHALDFPEDPVPLEQETVPYVSQFSFQFRHKSDNQVNNRQSQVLINGM